jgi:hypothetical protein
LIERITASTLDMVIYFFTVYKKVDKKFVYNSVSNRSYLRYGMSEIGICLALKTGQNGTLLGFGIHSRNVSIKKISL